jgi:PAS domain S-box-containing protein
MKSRLQSVRSRWALEILIVALLYYGGASLGLRLAFEKTNASPVWPSSGIALAAVLLLGYWVWPGIMLGAFLANVVGFLAHHAANALTVVAVSSAISIGNTLEAVVGAFLLRRLVGTRNPFYRAQDVFKFTAVALLACCVSPAIGPASVSLAGIAHPAAYGTIWFTWWLGDTIGVLLVTPLLLTWGAEPQVRWSVRRHVEAGLLFASLLVAGWMGFGGWVPGSDAHYPLAFVPIPWLVWAAFRFGPRGAATAAVITSAIAISDTVHGVGPFVQNTVNESLLLLQAFVGIVTVTILTMAAAVAERREAEARLGAAHDSLERRVEERTRDLVQVNERLQAEVAERKRAEEALRWSEEHYRLLFEANPYPMWVFERETFRFLAVNDAAIKHYGYSREEFLAMTTLDIHAPEDVPGARALEPSVGTGLARRGEWQHRKKDGTIIDVEMSRQVLNLGGRSARLALVRDITDLKRAAREKEGLEEQLRQAQKMEAIGRLASGP